MESQFKDGLMILLRDSQRQCVTGSDVIIVALTNTVTVGTGAE